MTGFSSADLNDAVHLPDHQDAVDRIKDLVIRQLVSTDGRASIKRTAYFNHSFVPDLVLAWQDEREDRYVFLRPEAEPESLAQDIQLSQDVHPIFYSLATIEEGRLTEPSDGIEIRSRRANSLVTDSSLVVNRNEDPIVRLATSAVLQGARGILDGTRADVLSSALRKGMNAAAHVEPLATGRASETISEIFDAKRSLRLNQLLQAVWVGSGGDVSEFPGNADLSDGLDEEAISYLIRLDLIDDQEFWSRIGRRLSLDLLTRLAVEYPSPNFQMLVNSNLDIINGRVCRIISDRQAALDFYSPEDSGISTSLRWEVTGSSLVLRAPTFVAHVADKRESLTVPETPAKRTTFTELTNRTESHRIPIAELTLRSSQGRTVSYSSESEIDPVHETTLRAISQALGPAATVHSVVALVAGHSPLTCDFRTSTTSGRTSALYPIADLIRISISLLTDLPDQERDALNAILSNQGRRDFGSLTLFGPDTSSET